ncbi:transcription elongation factor Spt5 [Candidatus Pacearchaeota archaeon]|nr:transcription elongation factor Spt5 [Candidatus Pacearchaeota archaeon]
MIFIIKVTTNKEERAVDMIAERAEKKALNVFSVSRPHGLRGYVLLEAEDRDSAEEAVFNLPYVKGIIGKTIGYDEIKNMVEPSVEAISIKDGDIVEIIAEPFKKEKAKVIRIDKQKEEVVVSLLGAVVPLPVTIKLDNVRVVRRDEEE